MACLITLSDHLKTRKMSKKFNVQILGVQYSLSYFKNSIIKIDNVEHMKYKRNKTNNIFLYRPFNPYIWNPI